VCVYGWVKGSVCVCVCLSFSLFRSLSLAVSVSLSLSREWEQEWGQGAKYRYSDSGWSGMLGCRCVAIPLCRCAALSSTASRYVPVEGLEFKV